MLILLKMSDKIKYKIVQQIFVFGNFKQQIIAIMGSWN